MQTKLAFAHLNKRHFACTPGLAAAFAEAVRVCLSRHHSSPKTMILRDKPNTFRRIIEWEPADQRMRAGWKNKDDATRDGAYGLALAAVEATRGLVAFERSEKLSGADYWLASPGTTINDLESAVRLEVSGIDEGREGAIRKRLRRKLLQAKAGNINSPAIACVVGFLALTVVTADLE